MLPCRLAVIRAEATNPTERGTGTAYRTLTEQGDNKDYIEPDQSNLSIYLRTFWEVEQNKTDPEIQTLEKQRLSQINPWDILETTPCN